MRAVEALGYSPDPNARALASARSDLIGVIVPSLTNSVFADVLMGMYAALTGAPYQIHFANSHFSPLEEELDSNRRPGQPNSEINDRARHT